MIKPRAPRKPKLDITETVVCQDCLLYLSSGEFGPETTEAVEKKIVAREIELAEHGYRISLGGEEWGVSRLQCELCATSLVGDRYRAFLVLGLVIFQKKRHQ